MYNSKRRGYQIGDTITILVSQSTSAEHEAGTRTNKRSNLGADFFDYWDQVAFNTGDSADDSSLRKRQQYILEGRDDYSGLGQTTRKSRVNAVVTAVVTEVFPNGYLYVVGENKVKVNEETETVRIAGIVRPDRISPKNTVFSHEIANVELSVKGVGVVASKQNPGIMTKVFNWFF